MRPNPMHVSTLDAAPPGAPPGDDLRVGDTDREAVMVALHDHFAAGRLDRAELDERLEPALTAKTRGDLRALVRDLPAPHGLPDPEPARSRHRGRPPARHPGRPPMRAHRRHRPGHPAFPVLLAVFAVVAITAGPSAGLFAVLMLALVAWLVRAALILTGRRPSRRRHRGIPSAS
ncbi:DUF1707 SHOCT-like domain-containing protein [Spirillospora albida]|uniref:DUF1707 SHOCT-like domain-containing protein n=1 Tax=Spirillospora albida TaxID=58123 RepID=UPI00068C170B|nr:DUF1707 domain-containing protein [Spirillospora albida]